MMTPFFLHAGVKVSPASVREVNQWVTQSTRHGTRSSTVEETRSEVMTACALHGIKHVAVKYDQWDLGKRGKGKKGEWEFDTQSHHQGGWYIGRVVAVMEGTTTAKVEYKFNGGYCKEDEALTRSNYLLVTDDPNEVKCGKWTALKVAQDVQRGQSLRKRRKKGVSRTPALQSEAGSAGSSQNTRTSSRISRRPERLDPYVA